MFWLPGLPSVTAARRGVAASQPKIATLIHGTISQ